MNHALWFNRWIIIHIKFQGRIILMKEKSVTFKSGLFDSMEITTETSSMWAVLITLFFKNWGERFSNSQLNDVIWYKNRIFLLKMSTMNIGYVYSIYKVCCIMSVGKALHSFNFQNFQFFYKFKYRNQSNIYMYQQSLYFIAVCLRVCFRVCLCNSITLSIMLFADWS